MTFITVSYRIFVSVDAVSYTHLDVYKRQVSWFNVDLEINKLFAISNVSLIGTFVYKSTMSNEARVCLGSILIVFVSSTSSKLFFKL